MGGHLVDELEASHAEHEEILRQILAQIRGIVPSDGRKKWPVGPHRLHS